jgi:16S rRNA (uracil1498-N3)-methyltransferase
MQTNNNVTLTFDFMNLFYTPNISEDHFILDEIESKHCIKVLRLKEGDTIFLVDGKGSYFETKITDAHPKRCTVQVIEKKTEYEKLNYNLHIAIAPVKSIDRYEWFLEKTTEIGISEITPLLCRYSERKVIKEERLKKIITSAMKQSIKAYHPTLNPMISFKEFIKMPFSGDKFIAHCENGVKNPLKDLVSKGKNTLILIGPEGDFSKEEIDTAIANGFKEISLGNSRLRTETAGVVACHTVSLMNL